MPEANSTAEQTVSHTPGPWTVGEITTANVGLERLVRSANGLIVATAERSYSNNGITSEIRDANARLIAAAPDLLEACRAAYVALPMTKHNEPINAALKAAIAKAEGR